MWNILVLALVAPALILGVAIPSSDDADLAKEGGWVTVFVQKHSVPPQEAILTKQQQYAVNSPPRAASVEEDIAELVYLQAQLKELKYLICEKKRAIAQRLCQDKPSIAKCDSLRCVAQAIKDKARVTVHKVIGKVMSGPDAEESLRFPKLHWPKPPFYHGKPGNHTCGPPRHSSHTLPHLPPGHGRENRTHPHPQPPHFKRPHLPFCHYPPPPPPRHRKPPHREPPAHGKPPHSKPPPEDKPYEESFLPSFGRKPTQGLFQPFEAMEQAARAEQASYGSLQGHRAYKHSPNVFHVLGLGLFVFVFTIIVKSFHRRLSTPTQKAARQTRRAERQHRRSLRRAAHRESILNILTRLGYRAPPQQDEEKRAALLADDTLSTTMSEDIAGLMNAADMVSEIVAAEEGRARTNMYFEEQGETLPVYDGQDDSGHVADGSIGNSGYIPSHAGSASDILNTKQ